MPCDTTKRYFLFPTTCIRSELHRGRCKMPKGRISNLQGCNVATQPSPVQPSTAQHSTCGVQVSMAQQHDTACHITDQHSCYAGHSIAQCCMTQHGTGHETHHSCGVGHHSMARHRVSATAQHSRAYHSTSQHSTAQRSTAQHSAAQRSMAQHLPKSIPCHAS